MKFLVVVTPPSIYQILSIFVLRTLEGWVFVLVYPIEAAAEEISDMVSEVKAFNMIIFGANSLVLPEVYMQT